MSKPLSSIGIAKYILSMLVFLIIISYVAHNDTSGSMAHAKAKPIMYKVEYNFASGDARVWYTRKAVHQRGTRRYYFIDAKTGTPVWVPENCVITSKYEDYI